MLKTLRPLMIVALCVAITDCQPDSPAVPQSVSPQKNAPENQVLPTAANPRLVPPLLALPAVDAGNVSAAVRSADQAFAEARFEGGRLQQAAALEWYLAIAKFDQNNNQAQSGLKNTAAALMKSAQQSLRSGDMVEAARLNNIIALHLSSYIDTTGLVTELTNAREADRWYQKGVELEKRKIIFAPDQDPRAENAVAAYQEALSAFPDYQPAYVAIDRMRSQRESAAMILSKKDKFPAALLALDQARAIDAHHPRFQEISSRVMGRINQSIQAHVVLANLALDGLRIEPAQDYYLKAKALLPTHEQVIALAKRIDDVKHYGRYRPHQVFSDAWPMSSPAPEMVVIPYGQYEMGAPDSLASTRAAEIPRHTVIFKRGFAIARNEVTIGQFRQFIESSGYQTRASKRGMSMVYDEKGGSMTEREGVDWRHDHLGRPAKDEMPVVHVNLNDAQTYAAWLSEKTGATYRLPSEAEFEYVLRAGNDKTFPWGDQSPVKIVANLAGAGDKSTQSRSWGNAIPGYRDFHWGAAPVRSFPRGSWGTFDMSGNVEEWVQDCWHDSYQRAPVNGSAWVNPGCKMGVTRGASWASSLDEARASFRMASLMKSHNARTGFRVVREL